MDHDKSYRIARLLRAPSLMEDMNTGGNPLRVLTNQIECFLGEAIHTSPIVMEPTSSQFSDNLHSMNLQKGTNSNVGDTVELNVVAGVFEAKHNEQLREKVILPTRHSSEALNIEKKREAEALVELWTSLIPETSGFPFSPSCSASGNGGHAENSICLGSPVIVCSRGESSMKALDSQNEKYENCVGTKSSWNLNHKDKTVKCRTDEVISINRIDSPLEDSEDVDIMLADECSSDDSSACSRSRTPSKKIRVIGLS